MERDQSFSIRLAYSGINASEIKEGGLQAAVSLTPGGAIKFAKVVEQVGADVLVIQSTVTSTEHRSSKGGVLDVAG